MFLAEENAQNIVEVKRVLDRVMKVKLEIEGSIVKLAAENGRKIENVEQVR